MLILDQISPRARALIFPISDNDLLIVGGLEREIFKPKDAYIFNLDQRRVTRKVCEDIGIALMSKSAPVMQKKGCFISLVEIGEVLKLVRYDSRNERLALIERISECYRDD